MVGRIDQCLRSQDGGTKCQHRDNDQGCEVPAYTLGYPNTFVVGASLAGLLSGLEMERALAVWVTRIIDTYHGDARPQVVQR